LPRGELSDQNAGLSGGAIFAGALLHAS